MAEYIDFEVSVSNDSSDNDTEMPDKDNDFIDDRVIDNEEPSFYGFVNQTLNPRDVLAE